MQSDLFETPSVGIAQPRTVFSFLLADNPAVLAGIFLQQMVLHRSECGAMEDSADAVARKRATKSFILIGYFCTCKNFSRF
jgi:hypothetical protein